MKPDKLLRKIIEENKNPLEAYFFELGQYPDMDDSMRKYIEGKISVIKEINSFIFRNLDE